MAAENIDASFARPFLKDFKDIQGILSSKFKIIGSLNDPSINGSVDIIDISGISKFSSLSIVDGEVHANISNSEVTFDNTYLNFNNGSVTTNGKIKYDSTSISHVDINFVGSNINISEPKVIDLNLREVNLNLSSFEERFKLAGNLQLGETKITRDFTNEDLWDLLSARTESALDGTNYDELDLLQIIEDDPLFSVTMPEYLNQIEFDISVTNSDSVWFSNNVAKFRTHPDLTLTGNYETPFLSGRITSMDDGKLYFLDREFEIKTGIIDFTDSERINPILNITAEANIQETLEDSDEENNYFITFKIIGPADDFDFIFFSNPMLEFEDIVSLLTIGVTYEHLQTSENVNALLQKRAQVLSTRELSKQVNSIFGDEIGEYLMIDYVGISGNIFDKDKARVEIKKNMYDGLEMSYSTSIESFSKQILKIKYKINKYLYWEGKTDQEYESSAGLTFRIKFK